MLFMLTGEVQTGKTRWLERLVSMLSDDGVPCSGVTAPGIWCRRGPAEGDFEKLGIENVLLPEGERVPFARRRDLAEAEGSFDPASQSASAQLGWEISDSAIECVNAHFATLSTAAAFSIAQGGSISFPKESRTDVSCETSVVGDTGGLLVVDEMGRLELMRGGGLTEAVALVEAGPTPLFPHALIVVRADLVACAEERFGPRWGECVRILPDGEGCSAVRAAFGLVRS